VFTLQALPAKQESLSSSELIAIPFTKKDEIFEFPFQASFVKALEKTLEAQLTDELAFFAATGKAGELFEFPISHSDFDADRILLIGVGDSSSSSLRTAGATLGKRIRGKAIELAAIAPQAKDEIRAFAIAVHLGAYLWNQKSDLTLEIPRAIMITSEEEIIEEAGVISNAITFARDLVHTPSNIKNPQWLAAEAVKISEANGLTIKVLAGKELKEFGGLLAVGNSSPKPGPRFVEISYLPKGKKKSSSLMPHVVIAGKGITFDTGGVSLKRPYDTMTAMKSDMAGAAAALAVINALPALNPNVRVTVLMAIAENALSGSSQRPSDVIKHYGGTTVEVINTDAEGRLVLADALAYADMNLDPDYLIDIATLTGAATLGLGRQYAAMYTRNMKLASALMAIGEANGDRVWHMPLIDEYTDALESDIADLNHTADKGDYSAGSVTAALFLEKFAGNRNWVHLDIAGTARSESDSGENPKGGTGFGVRLLVDWITSLS
jgi:leucyl aminopeptidase